MFRSYDSENADQLQESLTYNIFTFQIADYN